LNTKTRTKDKFDSSDGRLLTQAARESITRFLESRKIVIPSSLLSDTRFEEKFGCFVTLKNNDAEGSLRGCIGFPDPTYELATALTQSAVYAATEDPRFTPVDISELESLLVEVSILTKPVMIEVNNQNELVGKIRIGKDGLVMKWNFGSGLLLPQVATELNWTAREFLENLGLKAGSHSDQWLSPGTLVYKFQAQVFQELVPNGEVVLSQ
jgi:uncharacterized protein